MIDDPGAERRAREGVDAVTIVLLGRWLRRWGVILGVTLVLGLFESQLMPIFYIALAFAGLMLVGVLATRRFIANKLSQGRPTIIETQAREVDPVDGFIDVTPKDRGE
ncbi:hypothetical protein [Sphingomicrobium arenosum]|uniref:hypothetical protein n=1 Tax=Sphingomicrobium arenosum TaxID=2233861 RepID=UPI00223FD5D1|nr:hypothetical protein [Sphingomicrobium arenosum]